MLRLGAPAPLARGRPLPWMRQRRGSPERARRHTAASAAVSLPGVCVALRRPQRDSAGRAPPAAADLGVVPLLHGPEPVQPADRRELGLGTSEVQLMTEQVRNGLLAKAPEVSLSGEVEVDEVYVVAGHKGQPAAVAKRGGRADAAGWRVRRDGAHWRRTSRRSSV